MCLGLEKPVLTGMGVLGTEGSQLGWEECRGGVGPVNEEQS